MRLVVIALVFLSAIGVLVGVGIQAGSVPLYDYAVLVDAADPPTGRIRVDDSRIVAIEQLYPSVRFTVAAKGFEDDPLLVTSDASPPENFKPGGKVSIEGVYDASTSSFRAYKITTQCPSRYNSEEEAEKLLEQTYGETSTPDAAPIAPE